jgi:phage terminase large subunit
LRNIKGFLGKSQGEGWLKIRRLNFERQEIKAKIEFIASCASLCSSFDDLRQNQIWAEDRRIAMC